MAKSLDLRTYVLLERAFVRRLQRSWATYSAPIYAKITQACIAHNWDEARRLVGDLDMTDIGIENREWIQYMLLSCAVFGAGTVAKGKPSFVGVGTFDTFLKQVTQSMLLYLEHGGTRQVQAEALQTIAEDEAKTKALTQKWDESKHPRDPGGKEGGQFVVKAGMHLATEKDAERIKNMKPPLPPAWKHVQLSDDPEAELRATGVDVKGRTQYRYSAEHDTKKNLKKFKRLEAFRAVLPRLRTTITKDMESENAAEREQASVLYLIDKTAFRVGSDEDTKADVQAHGATTLLDKHAVVHGNEVTFTFTAKKGVLVTKSVTDERLAKMITSRKRKTKANEPLFKTTDAAVRKYMKKKGFLDFSPKDFRTYHGTGLALKELKKYPKPATEKEFKEFQKAIATVVSNHLGNTPQVSIKDYIDPLVWDRLRNP